MIETAFHSDIGARAQQQDRVAVFDRGQARLLVLADGLGGHADGAQAAQSVIDVAREQLKAAAGTPPAELLADIVHGAHERIRAIGAERGGSPHSTCVMLLVDAAAATWIHVGDSRLYRFREGRRVARTLDHSVVELLRLQGRIDEEEMKRHPDRNRLFEALGGRGHPDAETGNASVSPGDGFLLASDGLWENVDDRELEAALGAQNLQEALTGLAALARKRGGESCDNISVTVARYGRPGGPLAGKTAVR